MNLRPESILVAYPGRRYNPLKDSARFDSLNSNLDFSESFLVESRLFPFHNKHVVGLIFKDIETSVERAIHISVEEAGRVVELLSVLTGNKHLSSTKDLKINKSCCGSGPDCNECN
jgi:hypothetical protein